jgi:quinone-modifying oxidoreductase, subunit QmoA
MCHPTCGLEINLRRLKANPRIQVLTMAEVTGIDRRQRCYNISVKLKPRYVNDNCTACGECGKAVKTEIDDAFNYNLGKIKAAYLPSSMAYPQRYVIDPRSSARRWPKPPRPPASTARSISTCRKRRSR